MRCGMSAAFLGCIAARQQSAGVRHDCVAAHRLNAALDARVQGADFATLSSLQNFVGAAPENGGVVPGGADAGPDFSEVARRHVEVFPGCVAMDRAFSELALRVV